MIPRPGESAGAARRDGSRFEDPAILARLRAADSVTLGVVIEVPQPWADEVQEWRVGFGDNTADHMPTHITLAAPLKLPVERLDAVLHSISEVCSETAEFEVRVSGVGTFRPVSPVVYLAVDAGADYLESLAARVRGCMTDFEALHPYVPHVTIAMHLPEPVLDAAAAALAEYSCSWVAAGATSFLRGPDGRWVVARRHRFGA